MIYKITNHNYKLNFIPKIKIINNVDESFSIQNFLLRYVLVVNELNEKKKFGKYSVVDYLYLLFMIINCQISQNMSELCMHFVFNDLANEGTGIKTIESLVD